MKSNNNTDAKIRDLTWIQRFVKALQNKDFYGELRLIFREGKIKNYEKSQIGKPD